MLILTGSKSCLSDSLSSAIKRARCDCNIFITPCCCALQVLNISPEDGYCQGCSNTLSILGSNGSNGLRPILSNVSGGIYGAIIVNQWVPVAPMNVPRTAFAYVTTPRGKALAMGGYETSGQMLNTSDEFNRTLGYWMPSTNTMQSARVQLEVSAAGLS